MDARKLQDLKLSLSKSSTFKIDQVGYETNVHAIPEKAQETAAFILPNKKNEIVLSTKKIAGSITIQSDVRVDHKLSSHTPFAKKKAVDLPPNLKKRHPLYGRGIILNFLLILGKSCSKCII